MELKYGEKEIIEFDINKDENFWPNTNEKNYIIDIEIGRASCRERVCMFV